MFRWTAVGETIVGARSALMTGLVIRPLEPGPGSTVDFGAEVTATDVAHLDDAEFDALSRAVLTYHVVVVREQGRLSPRQQYELTRRFDPSVQTYGPGDFVYARLQKGNDELKTCTFGSLHFIHRS